MTDNNYEYDHDRQMTAEKREQEIVDVLEDIESKIEYDGINVNEDLNELLEFIKDCVKDDMEQDYDIIDIEYIHYDFDTCCGSPEYIYKERE